MSKANVLGILCDFALSENKISIRAKVSYILIELDPLCQPVLAMHHISTDLTPASNRLAVAAVAVAPVVTTSSISATLQSLAESVRTEKAPDIDCHRCFLVCKC